jgi:hypothetical protein
MDWMAKALQLVGFIPELLKLVTEVETIFAAGNGAAKKAVVTAAVTGAGAPPEVTSGISGIIDAIVAAQKPKA